MAQQPNQNQPQKPVSTQISAGSFWRTRRLISARIKEFDLIDKFLNGYRNREDKTNLPPGVLIEGSQNVLTNVSERIQSRAGYVLDGPAGTQGNGIDSAYTFVSHLGYERNLRSYSDMAILGQELVINGGFDGSADYWALYPNATYNLNNILLSDGEIVQTFTDTFIKNKSYKISLDIGGTSGSVSVAFAVIAGDLPVGEFTISDVVGKYTSIDNNNLGGVYFEANQSVSFVVNVLVENLIGTQGIYINGVDYYSNPLNFNGTIDNVSIKEVLSYSGGLEYRYVDPTTGAVSWITLLSGLTSVNFNFAEWWDINELLSELLMVNGTANIYEWGGGITTFASATSNTITKQGTTSWEDEGFYFSGTSHSTRKVTINGTDFTYTGGESTTTLTGVTPDPTGYSLTAGMVVHQTPIVTANSSMTDLPLTENDLITVFNSQCWVGSFSNQIIYISQGSSIGNYKDYANSTSPESQSYYGSTIQLDSPPVSFNVLENYVAISAGKNQWYEIAPNNTTLVLNDPSTTSVSFPITTFTINRLKTNPQQAAQSQAVVGAMKNDLMFISNEPTLDTLGRVEQILGTTQVTNISDPIKLDFDSYDFTNASVFYNKYFIYVAIPKHGLVRIFNIVKNYWEAPQTIPVSRFYTVNGVLYGHSSLTNESYQLFSGTSDNGHAINAIAVFSYQYYGSRTALKYFNKFYLEGYIQSNTTLTLGINYDLDGCQTSTSYDVVGDDKQIVCIPSDTSSLGKSSLGKNPLGGNLQTSAALPPHFQVIKTFPRTDFLLCNFTLSSQSPDQNWQVIALGPSLDYSTNIPANISQ